MASSAVVSATSSRPAASSASAAAPASSSTYIPMQRRLMSLHGTDDRVVLDIGSKITKVGFSGESRPRAIIESLVPPPSRPGDEHEARRRREAKGKQRARDVQADWEDEGEKAKDSLLWSYDLARCKNETERKAAMRLLQARVEELIRLIYVRHLKVDPKLRHVLLLDSPHTPLPLKEALMKVLFSPQFRVPSVAFVPSSLMALIATGRITGLVVDISGGGAGDGAGSGETTITPVYYGRIIETACVTTTRAGGSMRRRLRRLLLREARLCSSKGKFEKVPGDLLSSEVVDELMARICFLGQLDPYINAQAEQQRGQQPPQDDEDYLLQSLKDRFAKASRTKALSIPLASLQSALDWAKAREELLSGSATGSAASGAGKSTLFDQHSGRILGTPYSQSAVLIVPGWVRERAAEVLLEDGDDDELGIPEVILTSLLNLPVDLRRPLAQQILITGGMSMLPNIAHRLGQQLAFHLQTLAEQIDPSKPLTPAMIRTASRYVPLRNLAGSIAVLNDHASVLSLPPPPSHWPEDGKRLDLLAPPETRGSAPALPANLLPWIGASVAGALQTTSILEMKREEWDAAQAAIQKPEAKKSVSPIETRPKPSGRGSFVGVVGGLETGAFGGLSAVSRHLLSPTSESAPRSPPLPRPSSASRR